LGLPMNVIFRRARSEGLDHLATAIALLLVAMA